MRTRLLALIAVASTAISLPALTSPVSAAPAAAPAPGGPVTPAAAATGTHALCPTPRNGDMQCMSLARNSGIRPMGVQPGAAPDGYGPADLAAAYALPSGTADTGPTVAIVDAYDNPDAEADLAVYRTQYGLPACTTANGCFTKLDQRGGTQWPAQDAGWAGEIALDLDMVSAICPQCHLLLVEADTPSPEDLYAAEDRALALGARFISNSWGGNEDSDETTVGDTHFDHPGVVITASSGDFGYGTSYPAASPYVTAVGGTSLTRDPGTARGWSESAWDLAGSGCSYYEPTPAFQTPSMTGCPKRAEADVSAVADPATGVAVYNGGWNVYGGTSVAAPIIAGVYALAGAPLTGSRPNTLPYQHTDALNDVTSGSNGNCFDTPKLCTAGHGWDGPTGLGTPNGLAAFSPGPHGQLTGTVRDASGEPIADATVSAGGQQVISDVQGRFALTLPPDQYELSASKFGYRTRNTSEYVADGQTRTVTLTLAPLPSAAVTGTVRDGSGHGWPMYASVQVHGQPSTRTFTNPATGAYRLRLPQGGSYRLDVTPAYPGYQPVSQVVDVGATAVTADVADPVVFGSCDAPGYHYTTAARTSEPFDAAAVPDGWSLDDALGRGLLWRFDDPGERGNLTGGSGTFAIVDSDHDDTSHQYQDTSLVAPAWDLTGMSHPALSFHNDYRGMSNSRASVELSTDGGTSWIRLWIHQTDSVRGPDTETIDLTQWAGQPSVQVRFRYQGYSTWWWQVDDVVLGERACSPVPGGLLLGEVTDKNTRSGLTGARVTSADAAVSTTTVGTPEDASLAEGLYWSFSTAGRHTLTATQPGGYQPVSKTVAVTRDSAKRANFPLPAGRVTVDPGSVATTVTLGRSKTRTIQVTNTGTAPATIALDDVPGGVTAQSSSPGAALQQVPGTYRAGPARTTLRAPTSVRAAAATPQAAPWQTSADFPIPIADNAMAAGSGAIYSAGGVSSNNQALPRLYRYDPDAAAWSRLADMSDVRDLPQAAFLDGKLYVAGGWDDSDTGITDTMEVYDPATDTWSAGPTMPGARAAGAAVVLNNRMYVIGGCPAGRECGSTSVQVYDPATDRWESAADYPEPVDLQACGTIGGRIYCAGGTSDAQGPTRDGFGYDPATDRWSPIAGLPGGDMYASAYSAADGKLLMVGGIINGGGLMTNRGWAYDAATDTWAPLPNANNVAWRSAGVCGFYVVGGASLQPATVNVEKLPGYGDCATAGDVAWLSVTPGGSMTLQPGDSTSVQVQLNSAASGIDQPGSYSAGLTLSEDTPYPYQSISVTMTVNPPRTWGELVGTVSGASCANGTIALPGATVSVTSWAQSFTLKTDADGRYGLWLDARNNPVSLVVGKNGWIPTGTSKVKLKRGATTTVDFTLQPMPACH